MCRILLSVLAVLLLPSNLNAAPNPPANFAVEDVIVGLEQPIGMRFLPDGRMLLLQKKGIIRIVDVVAPSASSAVYLNLGDPLHLNGINSDQERGLLDIAVDPSFPADPYIYVFYTPATGPNGPRSRIARFTHSENSGGISSRASPGSEVILWQDTDGYDSCCHYGGGLDFGPDGNLWLTTGDHFQGSYAASLQKAGGKVIRIAKDGSIPPGNPFNDGAGPNVDSVFAYGLRNPFRARWDNVSGRLFIAEVGGNTQSIAWEDLHVIDYDFVTGRFIDADFGTPQDNGVFNGLDFGWPNCEGMPPHTNFPGCTISAVAEPIFGYPHSGTTAAINGGVVYRGSQFPAQYQGAYFYADSTRDFVRYLKFNSNGSVAPNPSPAPISSQNPDAASYSFDLSPIGRIVSLDVGPDGALYYISFTDSGGAYGQPNPAVLGAVRRYVYDGANSRPEIVSYDVAPSSGPSPLSVDFEVQARDPGNAPLTYTLFFGDGTSTPQNQPLPANELINLSHTYPSDGSFKARLEVSNGNLMDHAEITIQVGSPPEITSLTATNNRPEASGTSFQYGDTITFSAQASDTEDGSLSGAQFFWSIAFVRPGNTHPVFGPYSGTTSIQFPIPDQGQGFSGPVYYRCFLTVIDSSGLSTSTNIDIFPDKTDIAFDTVPSGILVQVNGNTARPTPFVLDTLKNYPHLITVPTSHCIEGNAYNFEVWSNGGTLPQVSYVAPQTNSSLTATYSLEGSCVAPPAQGLVMHLKQDAGLNTNGATVTTWQDQTLNNNHLSVIGNPTVATGDLGDKRFVRFDGVDDALTRTGFNSLPTGATPRSVFMVAKYNAIGSGTGWAGFAYGTPSANQTFGIVLTTAGTLGVQAWGANDLESNPPTGGVGQWLIQGATYDGSTLVQYKNGSPIGTAARTYNTGTGSIRLGEELKGGRNVRMDVAEVLVYNRAVTPAERQQLSSYFEQKYGIQNEGNQAPLVTAFQATPQSGVAPLSVEFSIQGTDPEGSVMSYTLDYGDGTPIEAAQPINNGSTILVYHTYTNTGSYQARLQLSDGNQQASQIVQITVGNLPQIPTPPSEGLVMRLRADQEVVANNNLVTGWGDLSSNANDLQAVGSPVLQFEASSGIPFIHFDGLDDALARGTSSALPTGSTARSVFLITRYNALATGKGWAGFTFGNPSANQAFGVVLTTTGTLAVQGWGSANDKQSDPPTPGIGGWISQGAVYDGSILKQYKNGAPIGSVNHIFNTGLGRIRLGEELNGGRNLDMDVAEVLVYHRALTGPELHQVAEYLEARYGIPSEASQPPVIEVFAATPTAGSPPLVVQFSGSAVHPEGAPLTYVLHYGDGNNSGAPKVLSGSLVESYTYTTTGVYAARLVVSDGNRSVTNSLSIMVGDSSLIPVTAGLVLQLESDLNVALLSQATVAGWLDQSGLGNDLVAIGNPQLVEAATPSGLPAIAFDGNDKLERLHATSPLGGLPSGNANRTVIMLSRYHNGSAVAGVTYGMGARNQAFGITFKPSQGEVILQGWGTANDLKTGFFAAGAGWLLHYAELKDGVAGIYQNGALLKSWAHNYNTVLNKLVIGEEINQIGYVAMDVAAVLVYDRALTQSEHSAIEAYLTQKYLGQQVSAFSLQAPLAAVTADLPDDHSQVDDLLTILKLSQGSVQLELSRPFEPGYYHLHGVTNLTIQNLADPRNRLSTQRWLGDSSQPLVFSFPADLPAMFFRIFVDGIDE